MTDLHGGTPATREFYEREGWHLQGDRLVDQQRFGVKEDGPIRIAMHRRRTDRILASFNAISPQLRFLELGCGGSPATYLRSCWGHYTGVDFSKQGLLVSADILTQLSTPHSLVESDITNLSLEDGLFDAVYSAHVLYHIDTVAGQAAALREAMRVLRPGGLAVFVLANPFPILFPIRFGKRLAAAMLGLNGRGPLPYLPLRIGWYRRVLQEYGSVDVEGYAMPSTWFNHHISEFGTLGSLAWNVLNAIEHRSPLASAYLGNYIVLRARKAR